MSTAANIITITRDERLIAARTQKHGRKRWKTIRASGVIVRYGQVKESGRAARWEIRYFAGGRRHREKGQHLTTEDTTRDRANELHAQLVSGKQVEQGLSSEQKAFTVAVIARSERHQKLTGDSRYPIVIIDEHFGFAEFLHEQGVSHAEARTIIQRTRAPGMSRLVPEVVKQFLVGIEAASKRQDGSLHHYNALNVRLGKFVQRFPGAFGALAAADVREWLDKLKTPDGQWLAPKTWNHYRDAVVQCARFAKEHKVISPDLFEELAALRRQKIRSEPIDVYPVADVRKLFYWSQENEPEAIPMLTEAFFCGFRNEEIRSMEKNKPAADWRDVKFDDDYIAITKKQSKVNAARHAPLRANARAWLWLHRREEGPISQWAKVGWKIRWLCEKAKVTFIENGARHSFISYRVALNHDVAAAADEAGTSVTKVKTNYLKRKTKKEAEAYFGIMPPVAMPLFDFAASPIRPQQKKDIKKA